MTTTKAGAKTAVLTFAFFDFTNLTTRPVNPTTGEKEYKLQDHLGSTRVVIHESGTVTSRTDNDAWGEIIWQSGTETRKGFIDKEKDAESGDHNFGARQYSPENGGRFGSIDPLWEKYRAYSPYNYAENNPLRFKDPSGFGPGDASRIQPEWTDEYTGDIVGRGGGGVGASLGQIISNVIGLVADAIMLNAVSEKISESNENGGEQTKEQTKEKPDPKPGSSDGPGSGKKFSDKTKATAREESNDNCTFCGNKTTREPSPSQSNIDHAIPKSRGGDNTLNNAQNTCRTCNQQKGTRTTEEFVNSLIYGGEKLKATGGN